MSNSNPKSEFLNRSNISIEKEEIDLVPFLRTIVRKKFLISAITSFGTIAGLIFSLKSPEIYRGGFQIVVEEKKQMEQGGAGGQIFLEYSLDRENRTQVYILRSNLVLKPVYEKLKANNLDNKKYNLTNYIDWSKKLKIRFKEFSKILEVNMIDKNKDLIIDSLNEISYHYQLFSRRDREKSLSKTLEYLEIQKNNLEKETLKSSKELNEFTVLNGLGDIDGFVELGNQKFDFNSLEIINEDYPFGKNLLNTPAFNQDNIKGDQRYGSQFALLEKYETQYIDLSSKLKPNTKTLISLKTKIQNLRESLKRPSEIILKFNDLTKKASRDANMLESITNNLELSKLEKIKTQDPWELITEPRIRNKVWPNKKLIVALSFIGSLIFGLLLSSFKEKINGTIFEVSKIKNNLKLQFIGNLYLNDLYLNLKFILSFLNISKKDIKDNTLSFVFFSKDKSLNKKAVNFLPPNFFKNYNNLLSDEPLSKYENLILVIEYKELNSNDMELLNEMIFINKKNIRGWFYIENNKL